MWVFQSVFDALQPGGVALVMTLVLFGLGVLATRLQHGLALIQVHKNRKQPQVYQPWSARIIKPGED
jgi:hypothetical protein